MTDITFPREAIDNLTNHQGQLDMDGTMVAVSRQALDEVLTFIRAQPKYKRVDLDADVLHGWKQGHNPFQDGYNDAIAEIKSKYGDLWVVIEK